MMVKYADVVALDFSELDDLKIPKIACRNARKKNYFANTFSL